MKMCSHWHKVILIAEQKRVSSYRHECEPVWEFLHVNTNCFQSSLWLNKAHDATHVHNVVWAQNIRKEFRSGVNIQTISILNMSVSCKQDLNIDYFMEICGVRVFYYELVCVVNEQVCLRHETSGEKRTKHSMLFSV